MSTQTASMSVSSDMNGSWSTMSTRRSRKSQGNSVFLTSDKNEERGPRRPACVSAKNSGMRFQSWREPKPLRSRCGSAVAPVHDDFIERPRTERPPRSSSSSTRQGRDIVDEADMRESVNRLSQPTQSSRYKTSNRPREAGTDMNWYSWSKMNVYKDYQRVLYKDNGTMKKAIPGKAR